MLLLLQSSDRIAHDICHAFDACAAPPAVTAAPAAAAAAAPTAADTAAAAGASAPAASASAAPGQPVTSRSQAQQEPQQQQQEAAGQQEAPGGGAALSRPQVPRVLALRAWRDMRPGREFRCFVRGREIVGAAFIPWDDTPAAMLLLSGSLHIHEALRCSVRHCGIVAWPALLVLQAAASNITLLDEISIAALLCCRLWTPKETRSLLEDGVFCPLQVSASGT